MLSLIPYSSEMADEWNALVARSKNGTFLFDRLFMDYHADRFVDCSLVFRKGKKAVAVMPCNFVADEHYVYSHQGLTYGGLIMDRSVTTSDVMEAFELAFTYFRSLGAERLVYKPVPSFYTNYPAEEPLYALYRHGGRLTARGLSGAIVLDDRIPLRESRKSGLRKARQTGLTMEETTAESDVEAFWVILEKVLREKHNEQPVHVPSEMMLLMGRFPTRIRLFVARDRDNRILAGTWIFDCGRTVHTQYMAASEEGKASGALDLLVASLIERYAKEGKAVFDFGISTEDNGRWLNEGLTFQKEGFGARGVCYETWEVALNEN